MDERKYTALTTESRLVLTPEEFKVGWSVDWHLTALSAQAGYIVP